MKPKFPPPPNERPATMEDISVMALQYQAMACYWRGMYASAEARCQHLQGLNACAEARIREMRRQIDNKELAPTSNTNHDRSN